MGSRTTWGRGKGRGAGAGVTREGAALGLTSAFGVFAGRGFRVGTAEGVDDGAADGTDEGTGGTDDPVAGADDGNALGAEDGMLSDGAVMTASGGVAALGNDSISSATSRLKRATAAGERLIVRPAAAPLAQTLPWRSRPP